MTKNRCADDEEAIQQPNVVLLVLDTARAKTVYSMMDEGLLPGIARIAREGAVFENARTTAPWTLPSHASLFTGQRSSDHQTHAGSQKFSPRKPILPELLREEGYRTAGISGNAWISPEFGYDKGFDRFAMSWDLFWDGPNLATLGNEDSVAKQLYKTIQQVPREKLPKAVLSGMFSKYFAGNHDDGGKWSTSRAINWISDRKETPFFLFMNYLEPHLEYHPPNEYRDKWLPDGISKGQVEEINQDQWAYISGSVEMDTEDFRVLDALYRAEIEYVDTQIERLYKQLSELDILSDTLFIVVGDHGENIGDHGLMDHQYCLYDTLLRVPMVVRYSPEFDAGSEIDGIVETRDLFPTILRAAGVEIPGSPCSTNVLIPGDSGEVATREHTLAEYLVPQPSIASLQEQYDVQVELSNYDQALRAVATSRYKYIEYEDGDSELYDLQEDPEEVETLSNRTEASEQLKEVLHEELGKFNTDKSGTQPNEGVQKQRLRDLGYL